MAAVCGKGPEQTGHTGHVVMPRWSAQGCAGGRQSRGPEQGQARGASPGSPARWAQKKRPLLETAPGRRCTCCDVAGAPPEVGEERHVAAPNSSSGKTAVTGVAPSPCKAPEGSPEAGRSARSSPLGELGPARVQGSQASSEHTHREAAGAEAPTKLQRWLGDTGEAPGGPGPAKTVRPTLEQMGLGPESGSKS